MAPKVIPRKTKVRVCELIAAGLTREEVAGAKKMAVSTVDRILAVPEFRAIANATAKLPSMKTDVSENVRLLLTATKSNGEPDLAMRQKGIEAWMKNPVLLESTPDEDEDGILPEGVILRYPVPPSARLTLEPEEDPVEDDEPATPEPEANLFSFRPEANLFSPEEPELPQPEVEETVALEITSEGPNVLPDLP